MAKRSNKAGNESHVYHDDGQLAGLYTIDGVEVRRVFGNKKFWQGVDEIIRLYREINPNEMKYAQVENESIKADNKNKFAGNESGSMRQALNLPYSLYLTLIDFEPTLFRNKKTRTKFMKRYPLLRTCKVV